MITKRSTSLFVTFLVATFMLPLLQAEFSINPVQATIFDPEITYHKPPKKPQMAPSSNIVRVGISNNDFSNYQHSEISLTSEDSFSIINKNNSERIMDLPANTTLKIKMKEKSFHLSYIPNNSEDEKDIFLSEKVSELLFVPSNGLTKVVGLKRKGLDAVYRGVFELKPFKEKENTFALVNVLDIETYLRGVVPNEMPIRFGNEALKAQAVAARNYVLKPRIKYYEEYDICDSISCQVYFGANTEHVLSDIAIKETENNVATYNGDLILAQYSSTAGGYTENYENCFTSQKDKCIGCPDLAIPYLKGRPDQIQIPELSNEEEARKFYTTSPESFDVDSPYYRWKREWTKDELEKVLAKNITNPSLQNFITTLNPEQTDFGSLLKIEVLERGVSGKVISLKITTDKNEFIVRKELVIRKLFKKEGKNLPSANIVFDLFYEQIAIDKTTDSETEIAQSEQENEQKLESSEKESEKITENNTTTENDNSQETIATNSENIDSTTETVNEESAKDNVNGITETVNTANTNEKEQTTKNNENIVEVATNNSNTSTKEPTIEYTNGELQSIVVYGGGYGHGVGMSQFGAGKMHELGYTYDEILQHYYSGIAITTPIMHLSAPDKIMQTKQSFWAPSQKAFLYIENKNAPAKINVNINDETFEIEITRNSNPKVYTDISRYIKVGQNNVTYSIAEGGHPKQTTDIYITLKEAKNE